MAAKRHQWRNNGVAKWRHQWHRHQLAAALMANGAKKVSEKPAAAWWRHQQK
jgi:thiamine pyrophosphate-dependent acetolactate synthase large subunit-like protein